MQFDLMASMMCVDYGNRRRYEAVITERRYGF